MAQPNALCPKCHAEITVNVSDEASICQRCGAPFITAKAAEAFAARQIEPATDSGTFPEPYQITLKRAHNPAIRDSITFILIINGRPKPLPDDGTIILLDDRKQFEIPVFITNNSRRKFEGVLTGTADGTDIRIVWDPDRQSKTLGVIRETSNDTVVFRKQPGATKW